MLITTRMAAVGDAPLKLTFVVDASAPTRRRPRGRSCVRATTSRKLGRTVVRTQALRSRVGRRLSAVAESLALARVAPRDRRGRSIIALNGARSRAALSIRPRELLPLRRARHRSSSPASHVRPERGTSKLHRRSPSPRGSGSTASSTPPSGHLEHELVVHRPGSCAPPGPLSHRADGFTIATLRMSAADVPWMGVFFATRSASARRPRLAEWRFGRKRRRPRSVRTASPFRAASSVCSMKRCDPAVTLEVRLDEARGFGARDARLLGERAVPHAVDHAEVDGLRACPHLARDLVLRHSEDERRRPHVNVLVRPEGLDQPRVLRQVGEDAQLDLRIVRAHDHASSPSGSDERARGSGLPTSVRMGMFCGGSGRSTRASRWRPPSARSGCGCVPSAGSPPAGAPRCTCPTQACRARGSSR